MIDSDSTVLLIDSDSTVSEKLIGSDMFIVNNGETPTGDKMDR